MTETSPHPSDADAGPVAPAAQEWLTLRPIPRSGVRIEGGFWGRYRGINRDTTIPHGMEMLEESGSLENLRIAAGITTGEYAMPLFRDSDIYKVLEAIAWERRRGLVPEQERFFAEAVRLLREVQRPDGYLNSYVEVVESGKRFENPAMGHELYCAGHLLQAAVADLRTGGDPGGLAAIAGRYADLLAELLPGPLAGYVPGHPEIETALIEFARATGRREFIDVAADLIARRGRSTLRWHSFGPVYFSDDVPFEQADKIRGHAVRALYLLAGATDLYTETGRPELLRAALAQWDDMVSGKTYLTGGVGSRHKDEAFGEPFELPPDHAYCETCAAVASIMWNWRMLLVTGQARFAELVERTLYNGFLAALGLDGTSFFYVNSLHSRTPSRRRPWYRVACCPPNIMRLLASLDHYVATTTDAGVQIHQFVAGRIDVNLAAAGHLELELATGYPCEGTLRLRVRSAPGGEADIAIRVPTWVREISTELNGRQQRIDPGVDHYVHVRRTWSAGDELRVEFPLEVRTVHPDRDIDAVRSCVALERGPLVYCFEGVDVPGNGGLAGVSVRRGARPTERSGMEVAGEPLVAVSIPGLRDSMRAGWPYHSGVSAPAGNDGGAEINLTAIPYYSWANREATDMRVWIPSQE